MTQEKQEVDYFGYVYDDGQPVQLEGNVLLLIAKFMTEVIQKETEVFAPFTYALNSQEIKDENGNLVRVEAEYKEHSKTSFMLTATSDDGAQLGLTHLGVKASQILSGLLHVHEKNINNKTAKKVEDKKVNDVFKA